ncbi:GNAT family N-acetyltransferase [Aquimarina spongiae]|uniref:Acetyltransferase (GNAT) family protein n=1 Tax=Aquimarina spongiae TaxID=570521 RepID=A0A1M6BH91_9FLAO|nr:GNAT family N-acetyltransferase [Aquimarina spongiae]SHI47843.1 Acetyltransferase (GNAT) family protein [Aquimarina spongiae]
MKITTCTRDEARQIVDGINQYNLNHVPAVLQENWTPIDYVLKNKEDQVIGGILAGIGYWAGLEIKILWVHEDYRQQGLGTKLLQKAEQEAIIHGATLSSLDTFDFQAEQFYLKNGYQEFGRLANFPEGHQRIYLSKKLSK